jgi:lysophospholipase L1-like esterase
MGDSTMQQNYASTYPQVGWPQALPLFLNDEVEIFNFARNGCSTKSFRDLGLFDEVMNQAHKGDYCFIQFGHNDAKIDNPLRYTDPETTYQENLQFFIEHLKSIGAVPVLLTSIYRRNFDSTSSLVPNCHGQYPEAMKDVAKKNRVLLLDMCTATFQMLQKLGDEASKRLFMNFDQGLYDNYSEGMRDNTHLRFDGAYEVSKIFIDELVRIKHPLCSFMKFEVNHG